LILAVKKDPGRADALGAERGNVEGPKVITQIIGPGQTHTFTFGFDTFSVAAVGFQANAPIHCRMVNNEGLTHFNQTVRVGRYVGHRMSDAGYGVFVVTLRNPNRVPATYRLMTN